MSVTSKKNKAVVESLEPNVAAHRLDQALHLAEVLSRERGPRKDRPDDRPGPGARARLRRCFSIGDLRRAAEPGVEI